ncbi:MAG: ABC transporter permease subunit [Clostridia bacterium]|nr:ABC transporter permease subunit [Clostridia bacterium]
MKKLIWKNVIQTLAAIAFLLIVWLIAYFSVGNKLLIPPLSDSLKEMGGLLANSAFWRALGMTVLRAFGAFAISFIFALVFAVVAYLYPSIGNFLAPLVSMLRSMPVLAVLLILLSFLGAGQAPIAVAFLSLFPMLYAGISAALSGIDKHLIEMSRVCGTPLWRKITAIYLPLSAPYILKESAAALSFSLKLIVSAEVLAHTAKSLGGMMQESKIYSEIPQLFALVGVAFLVGLILETAVGLLASAVEKRVK